MPLQQPLVLGLNPFLPAYSAPVTDRNTPSNWLAGPQLQYLGPMRPPIQQQQQQRQSMGPSCSDLLKALDIRNFEEDDLRYINAKLYQIGLASQHRAKAVLLSREFRKWLIKPGSTKLLTQGDEDAEGSEVSGLTSLSAILTQGLSTKQQYIRLVFFCSCHIDEEKEDYNGGTAIFKIFISQLLLQHRSDLSSLQGHETILDRVKAGKFADLRSFLVLLLRQIPKALKVVCIIDEIGQYEIDEYGAHMLAALKTILRQSQDSGSGPVIKVLVTSSDPTDRVSELFHEGDQLHLTTVEDLEDFGGNLQDSFGLVGGADGSDSESSSDSDPDSDSKSVSG